MNQNTAFRSSVVYYTRGSESNIATNEYYPWVISGQSNPSMGYQSSIDGKLLYINKTNDSAKGDAMGYTGQIEYPQSLVNKKYVDDAVNNGFAGGGTLTNPVILGTTQFSTSGEGQLLNVLNKPANAGLEIWVGSGSVGTSEQVVLSLIHI